MSLAGRTFSSLRIPEYRRFYIGNVSSLLGFWIRLVVQSWLVFEITGSKTWLGVIAAVSMLPLLVLSPLGGLLGDRIDRRLILTTMPLISVGANLYLGFLVVSDAIRVEHILITAVVIGAARAVEIPVRNAFVRNLVGLDQLPNAVALNAAGFNTARVAGPALGAVLLPFLGVGPCFFVAAGLNATMILAMFSLRGVSPNTGVGEGGAFSQLVEGLRYVHGHRRTRTLFLLFAITILTTWTYQTLMPAYASEYLGLGESGYSLLMAVIGLGALIGALWVAGRAGAGGNRRGTVFGLIWIGGISVFLLGLLRHPVLAVPLLLLAGFCQVSFFATASGIIQMSVPDELRGRVMGLWTFTFGASFPLGSLVMGTVSENYGIPVIWCGGAAFMLVATIWFRSSLPPRGVVGKEMAAEQAARLELEAKQAPGVGGPPA